MASPLADSYSGTPGEPIIGGASPRQPIIATGSYTANGSSLAVSLGFSPDLVLTKTSGKYLVWHGAYGWHGRSNRLYSANSITGGITFDADGFSVGSHADVNANGVEYDYLAIADNGSGLLAITSWMGNLTDNREISYTKQTPEFAFVKRDSPRVGVFKHKWLAADVSIPGDASGVGTYIREFLATGIKVNGSLQVNELDGPATVGEGIESIALMPSQFMQVVTWAGDGTTGREIAVDFEPCAYLLFRDDGTTSQPVFKTDTMAANECAVLGASANLTGRVGAFSATGFLLGDATYNASGKSFTAICFKKNSPSVYSPSVLNPSVFGVQLSGSGSRIEIGNDSSLDLATGPFSLEWFGRINAFPTQAIPLFMRGECDNGTVANAGKMSWGFFAYPPVDPYAHGWIGHVLRLVHSNYYAATLTESNTNYYCWNTGTRLPAAETDLHIIVTHDGSGHWRVCMNGKWVKDRAINLEQPAFGNRSNGGSGAHKVSVGARFDSAGVAQDAAPITVFGLRVYDYALTDDEGRNRYSRSMRGTSHPDSSPVEEWDFTAGTGSTIPALNSANNAAIINGTWVTR